MSYAPDLPMRRLFVAKRGKGILLCAVPTSFFGNDKGRKAALMRTRLPYL